MGDLPRNPSASGAVLRRYTEVCVSGSPAVAAPFNRGLFTVRCVCRPAKGSIPSRNRNAPLDQGVGGVYAEVEAESDPDAWESWASASLAFTGWKSPGRASFRG